jgi:hypothetical protein
MLLGHCKRSRIIDHPEITFNLLAVFRSNNNIEDISEFVDQTTLCGSERVIPPESLFNTAGAIVNKEFGPHTTDKHLMKKSTPEIFTFGFG